MERLFKSPSLEEAAFYTNQIQGLYTNQEDGGFWTESQEAENWSLSNIQSVCNCWNKEKRASLVVSQH